ncbi:MAG: rRNA maturation RNase YbeY [Candidatus Poribacteria bacterium]|nr:rRNA maturation RNase YbeY [Candidatus Poribacteria bacterium]MEE2909178.1 rRNA maturation RNase YbeY [Candidatus Poribacteria bacterium]|tara:strand:+ start:1021 stop:1452 length:432 start_codon:yes stop_codon:yes gene_type:complete
MIHIRNESLEHLVDESAVRFAAEATLFDQNAQECEISVMLTDDSQIQKLNSDYRQTDKPTDVLAFAMREGIDGKLHSELLGDVIISLATAKRQADENDYTLDAELARLTVHGVLHLLGYHHQTQDEEEIMFEIQKRILCTIPT